MYGHIYPEPNRPSQKMRFGLCLESINYTSGSYISRTRKPEPNQNLTDNQTGTKLKTK